MVLAIFSKRYVFTLLFAKKIALFNERNFAIYLSEDFYSEELVALQLADCVVSTTNIVINIFLNSLYRLECVQSVNYFYFLVLIKRYNYC